MAEISHFEMEQALRQAGFAVRPYPTQSEVFDPQDLLAADRLLIAAGTAWEHEIERLYALLLQQKHAHAHEEFARDLDERCTIEGLSAALALLNSGVSHRYTAVYRAVKDAMVNVELADKLGEPRPDFLAQVPVASSFCQYVLRDGSFLTANSASDLRLNGHPYQGVMLAYCGVPIFNAQGEATGTVCHFDVISQELPVDQVERLHAAARVLSNYIPD